MNEDEWIHQRIRDMRGRQGLEDIEAHHGPDVSVLDQDNLAFYADLRSHGVSLLSRSGMTRRVARLVDEGLVCRANVDADGRGVVVALTDAGVARLTETAPVHLRGVSKLFVAQLDDQELAALEDAMNKVAVDCTFG